MTAKHLDDYKHDGARPSVALTDLHVCSAWAQRAEVAVEKATCFAPMVSRPQFNHASGSGQRIVRSECIPSIDGRPLPPPHLCGVNAIRGGGMTLCAMCNPYGTHHPQLLPCLAQHDADPVIV